MDIPVIDFADYDESNPKSLLRIGEQVKRALSETGFMALRNAGISEKDRQKILSLSHEFFSQSESKKNLSSYQSASENFGYQSFGSEKLNPVAPVDLKETFTMRNLLRQDPHDSRWQTAEFREAVSNYYRICFSVSEKLMRVFSELFDLPSDHFVRLHTGENVTLRLLHYPAQKKAACEEQLGAGAHTDYGMFTLLIQDDVGGLEVQDVDGNWHEAPYVEGTVIVNSGDLLCRWSNELFRSTVHRVKPVYGDRDRYSVACFFDPDDEVVIDVLERCIAPGETKKYAPITTREHLLEKIQATHVVSS